MDFMDTERNASSTGCNVSRNETTMGLSEGLQMISNSIESNAERIQPGHSGGGDQVGVHVASFEIPHLRLVRESNKVNATNERSRSSMQMVKQELDSLDADDDDDYFDASALKDVGTHADGRDTNRGNITNTKDDEGNLHTTKQYTSSSNNLKSEAAELPKSNFCSNCKTQLFEEPSSSKNFHEFLPLQYYDTVTGDYVDVQIIDALSEIFKIRWTCAAFGEIYKRKDLALCLDCTSALAQLYRLYNQFAALSIKAKSYLSELINFQKDLQLEHLEDKSSDFEDAELNYDSNNDSESQDNANKAWKRTRHVKQVKRYVEDDDDDHSSDSSDMENTGYINPNRKRKAKSKVLVQDSENEHPYTIPLNNSIPLKKRSNKKVNFEHTSEDETAFSVKKIDMDDSLSAFEVQQTDDNDDGEDEGNNSLQVLLKKLTDDSTSNIDRKGKSLDCPVCKKEFKFAIQLRIHLNSKYHKDKVKIYKLETGDSAEEDLPKTRKRKQLQKVRSEKGSKLSKKSRPKCCEDCGKIFTRSKELARHIKSNHDIKQEGECDRCGKKFKTLGGLKIHYAAHVRDDNKYSCKDCGKKFRKSEALELHERTDHGGFKPHVCTICEKRFRLKDKLKLHMMVIHEKKKPFPCPKCEKSFRTKYHLKIHDVSQHIQGGDSSIGCSQCKRKFLDREALEKHLVVHEQEKPYVCNVCSKGFHTSARLKLHEKSHQEVPSCLCPVCGRAYKHIRDLKLHEVVHQDESTYRFGCGDCPRRFYRIDLLRVHQSNEKHFSSEVIGPTVSKSLTSNKDVSYFQVKEDMLDEDDDDENETDNEAPPPPPPKPKRKKKQLNLTIPRERINKPHALTPREREMTVMHPHATVIYHPSSMVQLHLDQSGNGHSSSGMRNEQSISSSSHSNNLNLATSHNQRYHGHETHHGSSGSYVMNQRDRQNLPHYSGIQIQPVTSSSHPHIQFGNNTVYTMRDASGNPTLNVASGAVSVSGAEQIGFDIITSFINNLG